MQVQILVPCATTADVKKLLAFLEANGSAEVVAPAPAKKAKAAEETADEAPKKKAGRPKKVKEEEPEEDEALFGDEDAEESDEAEEDGEEEEEAPKKKAGRPKKAAAEESDDDEIGLDTHIVPAFKAYAAANGRDAAKALLKKLKVASAREIPAAKFPAVLKLLKAA